MTGEVRDYSKAAILDRLSAGRRDKERRQRPVAWVIEGFGLLSTLLLAGYLLDQILTLGFSPWMLALAATGPIMPLLWARLFRAPFTFLGWASIAVGAVCLIATPFLVMFL